MMCASLPMEFKNISNTCCLILVLNSMLNSGFHKIKNNNKSGIQMILNIFMILLPWSHILCVQVENYLESDLEIHELWMGNSTKVKVWSKCVKKVKKVHRLQKCSLLSNCRAYITGRFSTFVVASPCLGTWHGTYLEVALQLLPNEFVVKDATSNWQTGPLGLLHHSLQTENSPKSYIGQSTKHPQNKYHYSKSYSTLAISLKPYLLRVSCVNSCPAKDPPISSSLMFKHRPGKLDLVHLQYKSLARLISKQAN